MENFGGMEKSLEGIAENLLPNIGIIEFVTKQESFYFLQYYIWQKLINEIRLDLNWSGQLAITIDDMNLTL